MKTLLALALSGAFSFAAEVYVSSPNAKTYHTKITCTGLKRATSPMKGQEEKAIALKLKKCSRCDKPGKLQWLIDLTDAEKKSHSAMKQ